MFFSLISYSWYFFTFFICISLFLTKSSNLFKFNAFWCSMASILLYSISISCSIIQLFVLILLNTSSNWSLLLHTICFFCISGVILFCYCSILYIILFSKCTDYFSASSALISLVFLSKFFALLVLYLFIFLRCRGCFNQYFLIMLIYLSSLKYCIN